MTEIQDESVSSWMSTIHDKLTPATLMHQAPPTAKLKAMVKKLILLMPFFWLTESHDGYGYLKLTWNCFNASRATAARAWYNECIRQESTGLQTSKEQIK